MVSNPRRAHRGFSMGQHESINDKSAVPVENGTPAVPEVTPRMALVPVDQPKLEILKLEVSKIDMLAIQTSRIESAAPTTEISMIESPKLGLASIAAPQIAPEIDEPKSASEPASEQASADTGAEEAASEPPPVEPPAAPERSPIVSRFTLLAASLALAAGMGGMVGALGALGLTRPAPAPLVAAGRTGVEEFQALKENVVQARVEIAALKASIEAGNRNASAQLTKIGERIDRVERLQSEPATKLSKAVDTLDRLARAESASAKETTGSIAPSQAAAAPAGKALDGWIVRDVRRGTAFIEGRMGIIEVDQGDIVPGLGRVDAIRKQPDGRWVVVTTRGTIMSAR
jgi:hypothetical protein